MSTLTEFGFSNPLPVSDRDKFEPMWKWIQEKKKILGTEILVKLNEVYGRIGKDELQWFYKLVYIYPLKRSPVCDLHGVMYDEWYEVFSEGEFDNKQKSIKATAAEKVMGGECKFCGGKAVKFAAIKHSDERIFLCDEMDCFERFTVDYPRFSYTLSRFGGWDKDWNDANVGGDEL